ncbi:MAG: sugar transporter substrate-binding protein [Conexibacter sp.]|nr:sugar transporter substrate-binding protein [Conexibacter sp.]
MLNRLARVRARVPLLAAFALLASLLAACGSTQSSQKSGGTTSVASGDANPSAPLRRGLKIAFLPKMLNNAYFTAADNGGQEAAKALGMDFKVVGPSDVGASSQVSYINTLTSQRVNAIAISASDQNAVVPALTRARAQGIKVVTWDSDAAPAGRDVFINSTSAEAVGRGLVQDLGKQLGHKGQVAILAATPNALNQITWVRWMKTELSLPKYKQMQLVKVVYGQDDDQQSFNQTQGLLQAYPNLKGILVPTSAGIAAAARYVDTSKYKGKVIVTGLGTPDAMRKFIKDGTLKSFMLWDVPKMGYLASYAAAALASGQISGTEGQSFKAGDLGERTVGKSGEVILGPPLMFTAANIDKYHF